MLIIIIFLIEIVDWIKNINNVGYLVNGKWWKI